MKVQIRDKIRIGTVQFGLSYGITKNDNDILSDEELLEFFNLAKNLGYRNLDTAENYRNINYRYHQLGFGDTESGFSVQNKIDFLPDSDPNIWLRDAIENSTHFLGKIDNILVHNGSEIEFQILKNLMEIQKFHNCNIGISIYTATELEQYLEFDQLVVQLPFNYVNCNSILSKIKSKPKCKIQARSIFLQGLLLVEPSAVPRQFNEFMPHFHEYHNYVKSLGLSKLEFNLVFALQRDWITEIVLGLQNIDQLYQLEESLSRIENLNIEVRPDSIFPNDPSLYDPRSWKKNSEGRKV
jgi:aryl-alcohol dehydrogenase-like predicted oxidoreductase